MSFAASLVLAVSLALGGQQPPAALSAQIATMPDAQTAEQYVESYFADEPIMIDIARCESHFHQYDADGSVYRGTINHSDVGVMQVNEYYHGATAAKLGLDLYTIQGNVAYARYLYDKEGTVPWSSSEACWGKSQDNSSAKTIATTLR